ncbi:MAG: hypothetical protein WC880_01580 [Candidatus Paceibacterota bacterium]
MAEGANREVQFEPSVAGLSRRVAESVLANRALTERPMGNGTKDGRRRARGGDKVFSFGQ